MALITALLVLLMISSMIVGMSWLVLTDKKLGTNNSDRQKAFYGAEAGMEALTTTLSTSFNNDYALSSNDITTITNSTLAATTNVPQVQYLAPNGTNGFVITFTPDPAPSNLGNPLATNHTILSGTYAGLLMVQDTVSGATYTTTAKFYGNPGQTLNGLLYTPNSNLDFQGNPSVTNSCLLVVANSLLLNGNSSLATGGCPNTFPLPEVKKIALAS